MGQRAIRFSDLTNEIIEDGEEAGHIIILEHPALENGPVKLEVSEDEVKSLRSRALGVVNIKLCESNGSVPEKVTMEIEAFNRLAGDTSMAEVIRRAEPAYARRKPTNPVTPRKPTNPITENHGIWPWLVALVLALVIVGLLTWTGRSAGLWTSLLPTLVTGPRS